MHRNITSSNLVAAHLQRLVQIDMSLCLILNQICRQPGRQRFFAIISRLGDGVFWYLLIMALAVLYGRQAWPICLQMILSGVIGVLIYKQIKISTLRLRPYTINRRIKLGAQPLDYYSFPSGHTLHAINFTWVATSHYPELGIFLVPFAMLVALSRMALGLHYPTDVICGAAIGCGLAITSGYLFTTFL